MASLLASGHRLLPGGTAMAPCPHLMSKPTAVFHSSNTNISLAPSRRRNRVCHGTNDFREQMQSKEPGRSNQHPDAPSDQGPPSSYEVVGDQMSPYVQQRLAAAGPYQPPADVVGVTAALDQESERWPRVVQTSDGRTLLKPGFLLKLLEPLPPEFLLGSNTERTILVLLWVGVAAAAYTAWSWAAAVSLNLALILGVTWARGKLSLGRLLVVGALAWVGKLWLYWVCFVAARADELLHRLAPPVRTFLRFLFILWAIGVLLDPIYYYPLPWLGAAPGASPLRGLGLLRV